MKRRVKYYYFFLMKVYMLKAYVVFAVKVIWIKATKSWRIAKFYASWVEYQKGIVYRERLFNFGLRQAINSFIEDKWAQEYCLKLRLQKEPSLRWRLLFVPFTIEKPSILQLAAENGYL
jgi:hypothetical protein